MSRAERYAGSVFGVRGERPGGLGALARLGVAGFLGCGFGGVGLVWGAGEAMSALVWNRAARFW